MVQYRFELAGEADDAQLRSVLAETPMKGRIEIGFRREPSYFGAAVVHGARGYAFFRQQHSDGQAQLYLTTIAEGNESALSILTSGRAGLPHYHDVGRFITSALPTKAKHDEHKATAADVTVCPATRADVPQLLDFWQREGPRRQFFPHYTDADFFGSKSTFRHLAPEDVLMAVRSDRLVGTLGVWDQSSYRQTVVEQYSHDLRWTRPFYNTWAGFRKRPRLPAPGKPFSFRQAALPVVTDDDPQVFAALLEEGLTLTATGGPAYFMVGLHESDPLREAVDRFPKTEYVTRLFLVCWNDGEALRQSLDGRPPYLELGTL